jgi:uncharacterized coiled-coil DUF342 family protein
MAKSKATTATAADGRRERFPDLHAAYEKLQAEKARLDKVVGPLRAKRDAVVAKMQPLEAEARELAEKIKEHQPALAAVNEQLGALAKAMGGKALSLPEPKG